MRWVSLDRAGEVLDGLVVRLRSLQIFLVSFFDLLELLLMRCMVLLVLRRLVVIFLLIIVVIVFVFRSLS